MSEGIGAVNITKTQNYKSSVDEVFAQFTTEAYLLGRYEAVGAFNGQILSIDKQADKVVVKTQREVKADIPSFAKKFFKESNTLLETDTWTEIDGPIREASYTVDIQGTPVKIKGEIFLREGPDNSCEHEVKCTIEVKIPFIGGKIAQLVSDSTIKTIEDEFKYNIGLFGEL